MEQFRAFVDNTSRRDKQDEKQEERIKSLELTVLTMQTERASSKGQWKDLWVAIFAIAGLILSLINTINNLLPHTVGRVP